MIIKKFEEQVERFTDKIAVTDRQTSITYGYLNHLANRTANAIIALDKTPGNPGNQDVALLFDHGIDAIVGIFGALKAAKTYIPMDAGYPQKRLLYILKHSGSYTVLTNDRNYQLAEIVVKQLEKEIKILNINNINKDISGGNLEREASGERPAYILYTSGSTGNPKGVVQNHENVLYFIEHWSRRFSITESQKITLLSSLSHDASIPDIFSALLNGAALYPYDIKERSDMKELSRWLQRERITIWHSVPTFYRFFSRSLDGYQNFHDLQLIVLGGEEVRSHDILLFKRFFPFSKFANIYGQTESTVNSIWLISPEDIISKIIIGEPIGETNILLVDEDGGLVEEMCIGEIVIASNHIALEYWKDKENSKRVFKYSSELGRLYWTGDLGQLMADGSIAIVGRKDSQLKIRGFRVEPDEIELLLLEHPSVKEAVVVAKADENADNYLCAYLVSDKTVSTDALREHLSSNLPDYMIPGYFINIEKMPLTASGKLDGNALPEPVEEECQQEEYEAPTNETEKKMVMIWQELMKKDKIGSNTNFFDIGGHSLLVITLISKIHQTFEVELQLKDVFDNSTIKELSRLVAASKQTIFSSIEPVEEKEYYDATPGQIRMYVLSEFEGIGATYNIYSILKVEGDVDKNRFQEAYRELIKRHESLQTFFEMKDGKLIQRIVEDPDPQFVYIDAGKENRQNENAVEEIVHNFIRPFDLSKAPLIRAGLIRLTDDSHLLLLDSHHVIVDGISLDILIRDLIYLYNGEELPDLILRYRDYAEWRESKKAGENLFKQGEFWKNQFAGDIPVLELPTDYARPAAKNFAGRSIKFEISNEAADGLKTLTLETGTTMYMMLLALYCILLGKVSDQDDIVIGSPVAGRRHTDLEKIAGMFINTLALRNYPSGEKTFIGFLQEVKENALKAFDNQDYQYEELVEQVLVTRDVSRNPLLDTMFIMENANPIGIDVPGLKVRPYKHENKISGFDLTLIAIIVKETPKFIFEYCTELFKPETIERFITYFKNIVSGIIENRNQGLSELEIISEQEKKQILYDFNNTWAEYPKDKTIHELFAGQVERAPDNIALHGCMAARPHEVTHVTYRELEERSTQLACYLRSKGVKPGTIAAIMVERSVEMMIGILGILIAGGAYLPIDPDSPGKRTKYLLDDSDASILLATGDTKDTGGASLHPCTLLPFYPFTLPSSHPHPQPVPVASLAYVTYTSGSTGKPKGVMIGHCSVVNFIKGITGIIPFTARDRILSLTTISFDIFGLETLLPLTTGTPVVIGGSNEQMDALAAARLLVQERITIFQVTPSRLQLLLLEKEVLNALKSLHVLLVGGETFPETLLEKARHIINGKIYNLYGPTETTIWSTAKDVTGKGSLNIGKPIANTFIYILDHTGFLQPVGVAGHLNIAGHGVARGYINRPELTFEKFANDKLRFKNYKPNGIHTTIRHHSHSPHSPHSPLYRTGDLARWLPDGNIEFLGRTDYQVKIRGFRIELGEIEIQLLKREKIAEAVVVDRTDENGDKYLCAYIVSDHEVPVSVLREYLSNHLPYYMIPQYFIHMEKIPLTSSGKIDRKALPGPDKSRPKLEEAYTAPGNELEKTIIGIWQEVLKLDKVGIHDNFFDLGGNSLNIVSVNKKLKIELGKDIPLVELFRYTTIYSFAVFLEKGETTVTSSDIKKTEDSIIQMEEAVQLLMGD